MKRLTLALMLLATPAMAQVAPVETVNAYGASLSGVWHGNLLQVGVWNSILPFSGPKLTGTVDSFCRIGQGDGTLAMTCLLAGGGYSVLRDGNHIHFSGSAVLTGFTFDGDLVGAGMLRGRYRLRRWGIGYDNPTLTEASQVTPDPDAPDNAGKAALLRQILDEGLVGVPQDAAAMKKNGPAFIAPRLGAIQSIAYLGQQTWWYWPPPPDVKLDLDHLRLEDVPHHTDFFSVYAVTFADGMRLCGLHQRDDGVLDALQCV